MTTVLITWELFYVICTKFLSLRGRRLFCETSLVARSVKRRPYLPLTNSVADSNALCRHLCWANLQIGTNYNFNVIYCWSLTLASRCTHFFFTLDFGPFNTTLTKSVNIVYLNMAFNLSCSAQASPPASYRFYRGQESLGNISVGNTFTTSVVQRTSQVSYACLPFNYFGDGQTVVIVVEVYCKYSFSFLCVVSVFTQTTSNYAILLVLIWSFYLLATKCAQEWVVENRKDKNKAMYRYL